LLINFGIECVAAATAAFLLKKSETRVRCRARTAKRVLPPVVVIILIKNIFHRAKERCRCAEKNSLIRVELIYSEARKI
jgi:hypothetical protein